MPAVRFATFNVENLFARFKFNSDVDPQVAIKDGWDVNKTYFTIFDEASKKVTGKLIRSLKADVIALQEVENLDTLRRFRGEYLGGPSKFSYSILIDGNDPRLIDVAVLSRHPIVRVRSNQHLRSGNSYLFSRDCLEVELDVGGSPLHLLVNHFKSMLDKKDPKNGRRNTRARRELQSKTVKEIVKARFGGQAGKNPFIVLGDLNDYLETDAAGSTGIAEIVTWNQVENVVERRPGGRPLDALLPREGSAAEGVLQAARLPARLQVARREYGRGPRDRPQGIDDAGDPLHGPSLSGGR